VASCRLFHDSQALLAVAQRSSEEGAQREVKELDQTEVDKFLNIGPDSVERFMGYCSALPWPYKLRGTGQRCSKKR
jgi:hypothetical protein